MMHIDERDDRECDGQKLCRRHCMRLLPEDPVQATSTPDITPAPSGRNSGELTRRNVGPTMTAGLADGLSWRPYPTSDCPWLFRGQVAVPQIIGAT
ncbi:MAG: hypothetical protein ACRECV_14270, partial [Xanthobacteraceae bacterium]